MGHVGYFLQLDELRRKWRALPDERGAGSLLRHYLLPGWPNDVTHGYEANGGQLSGTIYGYDKMSGVVLK